MQGVIAMDEELKETMEAIEDACRVLIGVANANPNGECVALIRAVDNETGEQYEIGVRRREE